MLKENLPLTIMEINLSSFLYIFLSVTLFPATAMLELHPAMVYMCTFRDHLQQSNRACSRPKNKTKAQKTSI